MANKKVSQLSSKPSVLVTDLFPIADPSTGQLYKTTISDLGTAIGSGVSSVNGLVGAVVLDTDDIQELVSPTNKWFTDTRARAALSASSPLAYNSGTGVFSIPAATSSQNGYLTSTDWSTFNGKQAALSGTGFVKISGTTISYDNSTYALDSAVVHNTGTESVGGIKTFTSQAVFNNSFIIKNTNSGSVSYGGNTTLWTSDDSFNILVGTASSTTKSFSFIYGSNVQLTLPSSDGTLALVSNLSAYLPLTGGTLTGALSGTSVSLSSSVTTSGVYLTGMTSGSGALYYSSGANRVTVANYNASGTLHFEVNGGVGALTLNSDKSATFAGAISGTSASFSSSVTAYGNASSSSAFNLYNANGSSGTAQYYADFGNGSGFVAGRILRGNGASGYEANGLNIDTHTGMQIKINALGGSGGTFAVTGGTATFSSSVTTGGDVISTSGAMEIQGSANAIKTFYLNRYGVASGSQHRLRAASNYFEIASANSEAIVLTGGNVGIGTTTPTAGLEVVTNGSTTNSIRIATNVAYNQSPEVAIVSRYKYNSAGDYTIGSIINTTKDNTTDGSQSGSLQFFTNNGTTFVERMRITSGGALIIGGTGIAYNSVREQIWFSGSSTEYGLSLAALNVGSTRFIDFNIGSGSGGQAGSISWNGSVVSYNITSDYRLKEDLKTINGLEIVNKIKVYDYKWKASDSRMDGVLAHELAEVLPYAVNGVKDGEQMQSVDYSKIVPVMVQAIKDLKAKIETLENK